MQKHLTRRTLMHSLVVACAGLLVACADRTKTALLTATTSPTEAPSATPEPSATPAPTETAVPSATAAPTAEPTATAAPTATTEPTLAAAEMPTATVYMTTDISSAGLMRIYEALGRAASGTVAVKVHSGEPGGHYFLSPEFIQPLVQAVDGTIVECNTAYGGQRATTASHMQVMEDHGFTAIASVDIMDAEGTMSIPITGGTHLSEVVMGSHFERYSFVVNVAHFKGHQMGGFGGVIKNMAIGMAASMGKSLVHSAGTQTSGYGMYTPVNDFLESMAEAAKGIADHMGEGILYIDVMQNLSVDCDCDSSPAAPTMADVGILGSLDPVALDQACIDLVYAAPDSADLQRRIESRNGVHMLEHAAAIGLGSRKYDLVTVA